LLACHRREPFEKFIDCVARFEVIEQSLDRNSCAIEHWGAAHHLGATADNWLFHVDKLQSYPRGVQVGHRPVVAELDVCCAGFVVGQREVEPRPSGC
jgi:hypothetical protein